MLRQKQMSRENSLIQKSYESRTLRQVEGTGLNWSWRSIRPPSANICTGARARLKRIGYNLVSRSGRGRFKCFPCIRKCQRARIGIATRLVNRTAHVPVIHTEMGRHRSVEVFTPSSAATLTFVGRR
jgi:hypothetical protein